MTSFVQYVGGMSLEMMIGNVRSIALIVEQNCCIEITLYEEDNMGIIYENVMEEYLKDDVELSMSFFDFKINDITYAEVLDEYKALQKRINGDEILLLCLVSNSENRILCGEHWKNVEISIYDNLKRKIVMDNTVAEVLQEIKIIAKDIIEKFISRTTIKGNECTLCRVRDIVFDPEYHDMVIGGEVLPFLS